MNIKELRIKAMMTQQVLANQLGVAMSTVSRWERGSGSGPSMTHRAQLIKLFKAKKVWKGESNEVISD